LAVVVLPMLVQLNLPLSMSLLLVALSLVSLLLVSLLLVSRRAFAFARHSREGGNPEPSASSHQNVIPANAGIQRLSCENA